VWLTVAENAAEESPHTNRTRSRMQVRVARVTALTQKRHALPLAMMRLSHSVYADGEKALSVLS